MKLQVNFVENAQLASAQVSSWLYWITKEGKKAATIIETCRTFI